MFLVFLGLGFSRGGQRSKAVDDTAMVEARHQAHVAVLILNDEEGGVGGKDVGAVVVGHISSKLRSCVITKR